jgi:hypothetical protein
MTLQMRSLTGSGNVCRIGQWRKRFSFLSPCPLSPAPYLPFLFRRSTCHLVSALPLLPSCPFITSLRVAPSLAILEWTFLIDWNVPTPCQRVQRSARIRRPKTFHDPKGWRNRPAAKEAPFLQPDRSSAVQLVRGA